jgi:hypothetical protein
MQNIYRTVFGIATPVLILAGCAVSDHVRLSGLYAASDGTRLVVSGYLSNSKISGPFLFKDSESAVREDYTGGIDIVLPSGSRAPTHASGCVRIEGVFRRFDTDEVRIGFRSEVGFVEATSISSRACPPL